MVEKRGEVTNELLFETLKAIQGAIGGLREDVFEIKERLAMLEMQYASVFRRVDRIEGRLDRIETRLGLVEG